MAYTDLREYLKCLEEKGLLCHVTAEVDKDWEISAVCRQTFRTIPQERRPALMFDCIKEHTIPLVVGILGGSREIYATALSTDVQHIWETWQKGKKPIPPRVVQSGPCQEMVYMGADANLEMLPAPIWTVGEDAGPYHSSAFIVTKDPDTEIANVGTYRVQVKGPKRAGIMNVITAHMKTHLEKNEAKGQDTEVAMCFGTDPVIGLCSVSPFPYGVDELGAAGGIRGEPIDIVRCKTVDLMVPATAEIVVEGKVRCGAREPEGPFGEYSGYMGAGGDNPLFEVSCITTRRNPIYQSFLSQMPPSESSCIKSIGRENELRRHLRNNLDLPVTDLSLAETSGATGVLVIAIKKSDPYQAVKAMMGSWSIETAVGKVTIVVDDDIDVRDWSQIVWALSFRLQPAEDIFIQRSTDPMSLDPSQPLGPDGKVLPEPQQISSRIGIDATRKQRFPALSVPPKADLDKVAANWSKYGVTEIKRR